MVRFFAGIVTYQVVPPSGEKKNQMSVALASSVLLIVPPGYLNVPPDKTTVLDAVPSLVRIRVNDVALFESEFGVANVNVQLPVKVAVYTVPVLQLIVWAVPVSPITSTLSENAPAKY